MLDNVVIERDRDLILHTRAMACCGMTELAFMQTQRYCLNPEVLLAVIGYHKYIRHIQWGALVWNQIIEYTCRDNKKYGQNWTGQYEGVVPRDEQVGWKLAALVEDNHFGNVSTAAPYVNLFSSWNVVEPSTWTMDHDAEAHFQEWVEGNTYPQVRPMFFHRWRAEVA